MPAANGSGECSCGWWVLGYFRETALVPAAFSQLQGFATSRSFYHAGVWCLGQHPCVIPVSMAGQMGVKGKKSWEERGLGRGNPGCAPVSFPPCRQQSREQKGCGAVGKEGSLRVLVALFPLHCPDGWKWVSSRTPPPLGRGTSTWPPKMRVVTRNFGKEK